MRNSGLRITARGLIKRKAFTVTELSQKIGVSDTTVINLCNDLGFQGYSGFRKAVKKEVLSANEETEEPKETSAEAVYPDMGGFIDQIRWSEEGDAAIVYDCMRYITSLTEICSIFRDHGVKIILITDNGPCPRISMADAVIHCEQGGGEEHHVADTRTQIAAVDHILCRLLVRKYPCREDGYDKKIREGVFTRFNPYGVIEPDRGKKAPEF